jgi:DNA repair exonuclease SbcCD ATPase subunit
MKTIQILSISLTNFKGLRNQKIVFNKNTDIFGANGTGKTTIMDAFLWMLFGKDSTDRKNFEIKTLDKLNVVIPQIEHEVSAVILVDDVKIEISRILSEMWPKKKGSDVAEFSGNKTEFYWDGVPMQEKTFQEKVSTILDETVFKMITNPLAFNAMKWQDQRNVLVDIAGTFSDTYLAAGNIEYENLIAQLNNGKTLAEYEKQILASIKKAKEDLKGIPTRIDEVSKSKPESFDFVNLKVSLGLKEKALSKIDDEITDSAKAFNGKLQAINEKKTKANSLKSEIEIIKTNTQTAIENSLKPDTSTLDNFKRNLETKKAELSSYEYGLNSLNTKENSINGQIESINGKLATLRTDWASENAKELTFNDNDFHCPTCKRDFEAGDVEGKKAEMLTNFKTKKQNALAEINSRGANLNTEKTALEAELKGIQERINTGKNSIETFKVEIKTIEGYIETEASKTTATEIIDKDSLVRESLIKNSDYQSKLHELATLEVTIEDVPSVDNSDLKTKRATLVQEIDTIKSQLRNEDQIKAVDDRVKVLEQEQKDLAQQIANVEKTQFVIERFNKLKIDTLESKINEKFKFVKFRMFKSQINGGESECCDALIEGVPFSDANTASKINAGLDIINTLCEFYQVTAPIFIDNRESIVDVIGIESQLINLIVSGEDKKLRVA